MATMIYELSRMFIGEVEGRKYFLYSDSKETQFTTIPERSIDRSTVFGEDFDQSTKIFSKEKVRIICSLQEFAEKEGVYPLLMNAEHQYVQKISRGKIGQIKTVIQRKKNGMDLVPQLAKLCADLVCAELGFNIVNYPENFVVDLSKVQNVIVPATKLKKFNEELQRFIAILIFLEDGDIIFQNKDGRSLCISSCLKYSHIEDTPQLLQNEVYVKPNIHDRNVSIKSDQMNPTMVLDTKTYQKIMFR